MRRGFRWGVVACVAAGVLAAPAWAPRLLVGVDLFRVDAVDVRGLTWTDRDEMLALAAIGPTTNVWEPLEELEARLEAHPMVLEAEVHRALPRGLEVRVRERIPVGLVATPTLEPVDREGHYLPVDPARAPMDLPVLVPRSDPEAEGPRPTRERLANLARLANAMREDPVFWSRVSEVREREDGTVVARWGTPDVAFELRSEADLHRLREGLAALDDAIRKDGVPDAVDLMWADQVVVRYDN